MIIYGFDIETIPRPDLPPELIPKFDPSTVKIGNAGPIKAAEKIEAARLTFLEGLNKKMGTDPDLCDVITFVGVQFDTDKGKGVADSFQASPFEGDNFLEPYEVVYGSWECLNRAYGEGMPIVSFNGIGFDVPVLYRQAMRHDIAVSPRRYSELVRKYSLRHIDLMAILGNWQIKNYKSLDFYLRFFGIGQKTESMSGAEVYPAYGRGEFSKIESYCIDDVMSTCRLFARLEHWLEVRILQDHETAVPPLPRGKNGLFVDELFEGKPNSLDLEDPA